MTSSNLSHDRRRRTYVRLIGEIQHALHTALVEEQGRRQLTRTGMAEALQTNKSFITRKLNGTSNMTLETLADLAFALDRIVKVELVSRVTKAGSNYANAIGAQFPTTNTAQLNKIQLAPGTNTAQASASAI